MKRQKFWLLGLLFFAIGITACTSDPPLPITHYEGESCGDQIQCDSGLICEGKLCRKVCSTNKDCNQTQTCKENRCIPKSGPSIVTDLPQGSNCDNEIYFCKANLVCNNGICQEQNQPQPDKAIDTPEGGAIAPFTATVSKDNIKIRVLGSAFHGTTTNNSTTIKVNDGAWK